MWKSPLLWGNDSKNDQSQYHNSLMQVHYDARESSTARNILKKN